MAIVDELPKPLFPQMEPAFSLHYSQMIDAVNSLLGYRGEISLNNHINMGGNRVTNLGEPQTETDAVVHSFAEANYSAKALQPKLESTGSTPLKSVRRVNDPNQREQKSSWLTDLMSTPPAANTVYPSITVVGSTVQVMIPSSRFTFSDGSVVQLESRTDILPLATSIAIVSISSVGNVVTVQTASPTGLVAGNPVTITGVSPPSFNGSFTVASVIDPTHFTYQLDLGTVSGSGGDVNLNNVFYYAAAKRKAHLALLGSFSGDTAQSRLQVNFDGFAIVAVIVVTATGANIGSSGGGASPIFGAVCAGSFF